MKAKLPLVVDHGVPGVVATTVAHHAMGFLRQVVYYLAFAFIAPLGAHDCVSRHASSPSRESQRYGPVALGTMPFNVGESYKLKGASTKSFSFT